MQSHGAAWLASRNATLVHDSTPTWSPLAEEYLVAEAWVARASDGFTCVPRQGGTKGLG